MGLPAVDYADSAADSLADSPKTCVDVRMIGRNVDAERLSCRTSSIPAFAILDRRSPLPEISGRRAPARPLLSLVPAYRRIYVFTPARVRSEAHALRRIHFRR